MNKQQRKALEAALIENICRTLDTFQPGVHSGIKKTIQEAGKTVAKKFSKASKSKADKKTEEKTLVKVRPAAEKKASPRKVK